MERIATLICVGVIALLAVTLVYSLLFSPLADRRADLELELSQIKPVTVAFPAPNWDFDSWQNSIAAKPSLWQELIAPPPPPPPPAPKPPSLDEKLKDVKLGRARIGDKAQIISKEFPKGTFVSVGDKVNGCTVKEITKQSVTFSLEWQGKELLKIISRE